MIYEGSAPPAADLGTPSSSPPSADTRGVDFMGESKGLNQTERLACWYSAQLEFADQMAQGEIFSTALAGPVCWCARPVGTCPTP